MLFLDIIAYICIAFGMFFIISSVLGLFRFPDVFTKIHASSVGDSVGMPLCLLGLALLQDSCINFIKIFCVMLLFWVLGPISSQALIKAAWISKHNREDHEPLA